jgi:hypothetical protein
MSEGSEHAAILIAASYQALYRTALDIPDTLLTDCTILVLFAGFYVEATLNHILEQSGQKAKLQQFPLSKRNHQGKKHPGMQDKLAWFYNEFMDQTRATNWRELYDGGIVVKLGEEFPGFVELHEFRNDISHGEINQSAKSLDTAKRLRQQAKDLVNKLYDITHEKGYDVSRLMTYHDALASISKLKTIQVSESSAS